MSDRSDNLQSVDTLVVGAGIIGTAIASQLQSEGHQVTLLDREGPELSCSSGNCGHFATDIVLPLANWRTLMALPRLMTDPLGPLALRWQYLPKLMPWLLRFAWAAMPHNCNHTTRVLRELNGRSLESYDRLLARTGLQALMQKRGALTLFQTERKRNAERALIPLLRDYGINLQELDAAEVAELEPALNTGIAGAHYYPDTAHTADPLALVKGLSEDCGNNGGNIVRDEVREIRPLDNGEFLVQLSDRCLQVRRLVLATGAWSKQFAAQLGHRVPLESERGYHLMLADPNVQLHRPATLAERSYVLTPMDDGLRLAGTVELASLDAAPDYRRADILLGHARELFPNLESREQIRWMGRRPSLPDSLPVVGQDPHHANIFYAFGHQHLGLTQAAVTAEIIADLIAQRKTAFDIAPLSISRF